MSDPLDHHDILNPETHHEESDVNVRALLGAMMVFVVFGILTWLGILGVFKFYRQLFRGKTNAPMTSIALPSDANVPQTPRLQPFPNRDGGGTVIPPNRNTPVTDMEDMRAAEEQALHNPGWIDRQKGMVRLPIDVAKQLVLQRGLPVNNGASATAAASTPGTAGVPAPVAVPTTPAVGAAPAARVPMPSAGGKQP